MTTLLLGNAAPIRVTRDADGSEIRTHDPALGQQLTTVHFPDGADQAEASELALSTHNDRALNMIARVIRKQDRPYALAIADLESLWWDTHSQQAPTFIECDDEKFADAVAHYIGTLGGADVPTERPDGWEQTQLYPPIGGGSLDYEDYLVDRFDALVGRAYTQGYRDEFLLTTAGRDALHAQHLGGTGAGAQPAPFSYMAVSANTTAESAASTTLPGEITTAGGGLLRGTATYAHTGGATTTTLTRTLTANGSDSLPVTIAKIGILNAASVGTLGYEKLLSSTATLTVSGDNVTITETITAS